MKKALLVEHLRATAVPLTYFLLKSEALPRQLLDDITRSCLLQNLERFFGDGSANVARQLLDSPDLAVTGGFLLATIRGEQWEGDLDLIVRPDKGDVLPPGFRRRWSASATNVPHLQCVSEYEWTGNGAIVQLLQTDSIARYVGSFDLAFCRLYFVHNSLEIMDLDAVIHRRCVVDLDRAHLRDRKRLPVDVVAKAKKVRARLEKYRARGYTIDVEPAHAHLAHTLSEQTHTTLEECLKVVRDWHDFWRLEEGRGLKRRKKGEK